MASDFEAQLREVSLRVTRPRLAVLAALRGCDAVVQLAAVPTPTDYLVETHNT